MVIITGMQTDVDGQDLNSSPMGLPTPAFVLNQKELVKGVFWVTAIALIAAVTVTYFTLSLANVGNPRVGMVMASLCCLLIAPPISYYHLRISQQLTSREQHLKELNQQLQNALAEVNELSGMLPICSACKKIRDDAGYWQRIEDYISLHSNADFTHSLCPDCAARMISQIPKKSA